VFQLSLAHPLLGYRMKLVSSPFASRGHGSDGAKVWNLLQIPLGELRMQMQYTRRLMLRGEVASLLQLPDDTVQQLVDTRQILPIRIAGQERFDSKDLFQLIETYKTTAARRLQ
jgi:hypothetical protein